MFSPFVYLVKRNRWGGTTKQDRKEKENEI